MRLNVLVCALAVAVLAVSTAAQGVPKWSREDKSDPMTDKQVVEFTLLGKFLSAPSGPHPDAPALVLRCQPGSHDFGRFGGKLLSGFVLLGSVVDATREETLPGEIRIRYRLDDGKPHEALWGHSTNFAALTFSDVDLDTLLYGHFMPHKRDTSPAVRKVLIEAPEYLGGDVVAEFDMPDPEDVAAACGVLRLK